MRFQSYFYPRSPCGERQAEQPLPTATIAISIHALLAESDAPKPHLRVPFLISIHALLAESDIFPSGTAPLVRNFYPRSPCGERPLLSRNTLFDTAISIHALLAESDAFLFGGAQRSGYFYPRSPCGERHCPAVIVRATLEFLSTLSLRRATRGRGGFLGIRRFLSTLSLRRATANSQPLSQVMEHFYPRSPCGERRAANFSSGKSITISIHALLAESDMSHLWKLCEP